MNDTPTLSSDQRQFVDNFFGTAHTAADESWQAFVPIGQRRMVEAEREQVFDSLAERLLGVFTGFIRSNNHLVGRNSLPSETSQNHGMMFSTVREFMVTDYENRHELQRVHDSHIMTRMGMDDHYMVESIITWQQRTAYERIRSDALQELYHQNPNFRQIIEQVERDNYVSDRHLYNTVNAPTQPDDRTLLTARTYNYNPSSNPAYREFQNALRGRIREGMAHDATFQGTDVEHVLVLGSEADRRRDETRMQEQFARSREDLRINGVGEGRTIGTIVRNRLQTNYGAARRNYAERHHLTPENLALAGQEVQREEAQLNDDIMSLHTHEFRRLLHTGPGSLPQSRFQLLSEERIDSDARRRGDFLDETAARNMHANVESATLDFYRDPSSSSLSSEQASERIRERALALCMNDNSLRGRMGLVSTAMTGYDEDLQECHRAIAPNLQDYNIRNPVQIQSFVSVSEPSVPAISVLQPQSPSALHRP